MLRKRSGFTLIELLVVIAIIAILAAILFPVFARAREKARQTSCLSNMKQQALAVQMYASDWDEYMVSMFRLGPTPDGAYGVEVGFWYPLALMAFINNEQIFACPSQGIYGTYAPYGLSHDPTIYATLWGASGGDSYYFPQHQATNATAMAHPYQWGTPNTLAAFDCPADTILSWDWHFSTAARGGYSLDANDYYFCAAGGPASGRTGIHNDGNNTTYVDGHAKWNKWDAFAQSWWSLACD